MGTRAHTVPKFYLRGFAAPESEVHHAPFVWLALIATGEVVKRSPKNVSIVRGIYDGPGGFAEPDKSIEAHLSKIESDAAVAIRRVELGEVAGIPPEIWRFLAWQAARTPGWMKIVKQAVDEPWSGDVAEPPPVGFDNIADRARPMRLENPRTGEQQEVADRNLFNQLRREGWKWVLRRDDHLEMLHVQAWYFQVRHFPRLSWTKLTSPDDEFFVTSDRAVAWIVDGYAGTPPAALRHPSAQVVAPLTKKVALVGRHETTPLNVTPREVNRFVAFACADWVAGPTREAVEQAILDRQG